MMVIDTLLHASFANGGRSFICQFRRAFTVLCFLVMATAILVVPTLVLAQGPSQAPVAQYLTKTPPLDELSDTLTKPKMGVVNGTKRAVGTAPLAVGAVVDGYRFVGDDPSIQTNWEPVNLKIGTVKDGFRFRGGDPTQPGNWEKASFFTDTLGAKTEASRKPPLFEDFMAELEAAKQAKSTQGRLIDHDALDKQAAQKPVPEPLPSGSTSSGGLFDDILYPVKPQKTSLGSFPVGNALLTTILVTILAGIVGYAFYRIAIPRVGANAPADTGRRWLAWIVMAMSLINLPKFLIHRNVDTFAMWLFSIIFAGGIAFVGGWSYVKFFRPQNSLVLGGGQIAPLNDWRQISARQWQQVSLEKAKQHPLYGVKNWLVVFAVAHLLGLMMSIGQLNSAALDAGRTLPQLMASDGAFATFTLPVLVLQVLMVAVIYWLMFTKQRNFRAISSGILLGFWPAITLLAITNQVPGVGGVIGSGLIPWVLSCAVWVTYLQRSRRVRVTFENCILVEARQPDASPSTLPIKSLSPKLDQPMTKHMPVSSATPISHAGPASEEDHWATAMAELETGQRRPGLWAKAFAESEGDETKAKVAYLKSRVQQLLDAEKAQAAQQEAERQAVEVKAKVEAMELESTFNSLVKEFESSGDLTIAEIQLLVRSAAVNRRIIGIVDYRANTLLHLCTKNDMPEEVHALLQAGADPKLSNNNDQQPESLTENPLILKLLRGLTLSTDQLKEEILALIPKGRCPNSKCGAIIPLASLQCTQCNALFGLDQSWNVVPLNANS